MKHKSEAFEKFKEYRYEVEKQTKHKLNNTHTKLNAIHTGTHTRLNSYSYHVY